jgi:hypothetical protein
MAGLNLAALGSVRASAPPNYGTVSQAAFGPGSSSPPSGKGSLSPTTSFGIAFWTSVAATVALVLLYHSLPD